MENSDLPVDSHFHLRNSDFYKAYRHFSVLRWQPKIKASIAYDHNTHIFLEIFISFSIRKNFGNKI